MNVKEFHGANATQEVNEFVKTVKLDHIEAFEHRYIVFYRPYLTVEEVRAQKILEDENKAQVDLTQAEMHLEYLEKVKELNPDAPVDSGIENTKANIINSKASLEVSKVWQKK